MTQCLGRVLKKVPWVNPPQNLTHLEACQVLFLSYNKNLSKIRPVWSFKDADVVIHVFASSLLDYCSGL